MKEYLLDNYEREGESMKCGVCGDHYGELMVKHGEVCEDDIKAEARPYEPAINDIIRSLEEQLGEDIH
jgi:hypothetical protein